MSQIDKLNTKIFQTFQLLCVFLQGGKRTLDNKKVRTKGVCRNL